MAFPGHLGGNPDNRHVGKALIGLELRAEGHGLHGLAEKLHHDDVDIRLVQQERLRLGEIFRRVDGIEIPPVEDIEQHAAIFRLGGGDQHRARALVFDRHHVIQRPSRNCGRLFTPGS